MSRTRRFAKPKQKDEKSELKKQHYKREKYHFAPEKEDE